MATKTEIQPLNVVIVDDDADHLYLLTSAIEGMLDSADTPIVIAGYAQPENALAELPVSGDTVIFIDYQLGGSTGLDWLKDFVRAGVGPVLLVTSAGDEHVAADAFRMGASDYIIKSEVISNPDGTRATVIESLRRFRLERTNHELSRTLKVLNQQLESKNDRLKALTDNAHQFVDDVAHEFRTPLAVIREFASIIHDGLAGPVTEKQSSYTGYIQDATRDLATLIDDFLDSSKIRAQVLHVDRQEHRICDLLDSCWRMLETRAAAKSITLARENPEELPTVYVDKDKFKRSLANLVVNAIKFSEEGSTITIGAYLNGADAVTLSVTDNGVGMSQQDVNGLFQRFSEGQCHMASRPKGFGLGLSIVKELVAINLGDVSVESELGRGSTFSFSVPVFGLEHVIEAFTRVTAENRPDTLTTLIRVSSVNGTLPVDTLVSLLTSRCQPTDLIWPVEDKGSVFVVGEMIDIDGWLNRIVGQDHQLASRIQIEIVGKWPVRDATRALLDTTASRATRLAGVE